MVQFAIELTPHMSMNTFMHTCTALVLSAVQRSIHDCIYKLFQNHTLSSSSSSSSSSWYTPMHTSKHEFTHSRTHVLTHSHTYARMHKHARTHTRTRAHICVHACAPALGQCGHIHRCCRHVFRHARSFVVRHSFRVCVVVDECV